MGNRKTTGSICGFAALYMWYIAYQLFQDRNASSTMPLAVAWICIVFFAAAGIALAVISIRQYRLAQAEEKVKKDSEDLK